MTPSIVKVVEFAKGVPGFIQVSIHKGTYYTYLSQITEENLQYGFRFMLFNATFNNCSVISVLLVEENHLPVARYLQTLSHNVISSTTGHVPDSLHYEHCSSDLRPVKTLFRP